MRSDVLPHGAVSADISSAVKTQRAATGARKPGVLLTGFGPFPGMPHNVSADLVERLAAVAGQRFQDHSFHDAVLDTEWSRMPEQLADLYREVTPVLALHFGVARSAREIRIERIARNSCRMDADAAGLLPAAASVIAGGPAEEETRLPLDRIYQRLRGKGLPVQISDDAGGYLCNAALYHGLAHCRACGGATQVGFIHVPTKFQEPPLGLSVALEACLEIIDVALAEARVGHEKRL